ncbi:MAG: DUF3570 domain-containing protein [Planctomycetes bacterium]|nr:DUF3570 domain-containing protein [Planctomycetota bacterium]
MLLGLRVRRGAARAGLLLVCCWGGASLASAQEDAPADPAPTSAEPGAFAEVAGTGSVEARIGYYQNDDANGDGNPFLDEDLTVIEPVIVVDYNVTNRLAVGGQFSYDSVSSASIKRLSNYPEQSGASGDFYFGGDLNARYKLTPAVKLGAHAGLSTEYDYSSFGFGGDASFDLNEQNTTLKLGFNGYFDTVKTIRFNGTREGDERRVSLTANLDLYQILTPTLHMSAGLSLTHQSGFLETAFNGVVLEDPNNPLVGDLDPGAFVNLTNLPPGVAVVAEALPDTRIRAAVFGELRKYLDSGTSLSFRARLYQDSWGIFSVAPELRVYQWIVDDVFRVRFRYRFYAQTAAKDYSRHFFVPSAARPSDPLKPGTRRTQDSDLSEFSSHTIGLKLTLHATDSVELDLGGDYVLREDGIDQLLVSVGVRVGF